MILAHTAKSRRTEFSAKPLRQRPGFQSNPLEVVGGVLQNRQKGFGFARDLHFPNDLARVIHNADARLLDRYVQSSKMVHAALLLLMLEAVHTDLVFTISLKRSTQKTPIPVYPEAIFSYPQTRRPKAASRLPHLSGVKQTSDWSAPLLVDSFRRRF